MKGRLCFPLPSALAALALMGLVASSALAQLPRLGQQQRDPQARQLTTHTGTVIRATQDRLVMVMEDEDEAHAHTLAEDAQVLIDGKQARLEDLQRGDQVRVTTRRDDMTEALRVEATRAGETAQPRQPTVRQPGQPQQPTARQPREPQLYGPRQRQPGQRDDLRREDPRFRDDVRIRPDARRTADRPQLGVTVSAAPEEALRVLRVSPGSAADQAGIRPGDYILEVEGRELHRPEQLTQMIEQKQIGDRLEVTIWRDGREQTVRATLREPYVEARRPGVRERYPERERSPAERERFPREREQAWLGIMLDEEDGEVVVADIYPGGPAAQAGVRRGDVIVAVGDKDVEEVDDVIDALQEKQVGDQIELEIERRGRTETLSAELQSRDRFLARQPDQQRFRQPFEQPTMRGYGPELEDRFEQLEEVVEDLLDEIDDLKNEIRRLREQRE